MTDPLKEKLRDMEGFVEARCLEFEGKESENQLVIYNADVNPHPRDDFSGYVNLYFISYQDMIRLGLREKLSKLPKIDVNNIMRVTSKKPSEDVSVAYTLPTRVRRPVIATDRFGNEYYYESMQEAKHFGYDPSSISRCCKYKQKSHKNLIWKYATED